jgi:polyferredoxin
MDYTPYVAPKRPVRFALAWAGLVIGIVGAAIGLGLSAAGVIHTAVSTLGVLLATILWAVIRSVFPRDRPWTGRRMTAARVVVWATLGVAVAFAALVVVWSFTSVKPSLGLALTLGAVFAIAWIAGAVVSYLSGAGQPRRRY